LRSLLSDLVKPQTSKNFSKKYQRSQARITEVLCELQKRGFIKKYKVYSSFYWVRTDQNIIIVSLIKYKYLKFIGQTKKTAEECSKRFGVNPKSSRNRLKELEKLGLVKRDDNKRWQITDKVV